MSIIALPRVTYSPEAEAAAERLPGPQISRALPLLEALLQHPESVRKFGTTSFILTRGSLSAFVVDRGDCLSVVDLYLSNDDDWGVAPDEILSILTGRAER